MNNKKTQNKDKTLCKRCVLVENKPDITINKEGYCNVCVDFEKKKKLKSESRLLEVDLVKTLKKYRGKGKYDCLVMASGGKDSTASLYYMKNKYRMNPLVLTFDHGFENEESLKNVKNAIDILKVDWVYYKTDFMKSVFHKIITSKSQAPLCHICAIWYMRFITDFACKHKIPLIVAGWTKGQALLGKEFGGEYKSMSLATKKFVKNFLHNCGEYKNFPISMKNALKQANKRFKIRIISPHWYLKYNPEEIKENIEKELKWKATNLSYPKGSTNCIMNFASAYLSMKHYGYTHYHVEMSKLVRSGELSRSEALKMLELNFDLNFVNKILEKIGCNLKE